MAEFSKEYCEKYDVEFPYDFSIQEEFEKLDEETMTSVICEGYGFIGIANQYGECVLIFDEEDSEYYKLVPLEKLDEYYENKFLDLL